MAMEIIMSWKTAEAIGAVFPLSPKDHRVLLRQGTHWLIRTRESVPLFWRNQITPAELAELTHRSSEP